MTNYSEGYIIKTTTINDQTVFLVDGKYFNKPENVVTDEQFGLLALDLKFFANKGLFAKNRTIKSMDMGEQLK